MPRIVQTFEVPENGGLGMVFWRSGATSIIAFTTAAEVLSCRGLEAVAIAASSFMVSMPAEFPRRLEGGNNRASLLATAASGRPQRSGGKDGERITTPSQHGGSL